MNPSMNEIKTMTASTTPVETAGPQPHWRNILVPVDFSESSRRSLKIAVELAKPLGAKLTLLHVLQLPVSCVDAPVDADDIISSARQSLDQMSREVAPVLIHEKLVWFGKQETAREIIEEASELPADLIVMSVAGHGHGGLVWFLHASVAERVIRHAPCPVLLVRSSDARESPVKAVEDSTLQA